MGAEWSRVDEVFDGALAVPEAEREDYLRQHCGTDAELEAEVRRLLELLDDSEGFLREPPSVPSAPGLDDLRDHVATAMGDPDADPLLVSGERVGAYRLLSTLGAGGMGAVYLAERVDGQFEHQVAIKVVKPEAIGPTVTRRFVQERQILARLQHPNIARLLDGGLTSDERPYFVMELVEGTPLVEFCRREGLDLQRRLQLLMDAGRAVSYAHGQGVVHRDLKPSNILVTDERFVKLLDFGIAKFTDEDGVASLTRPGAYVLTPAYAAPEQRRGQQVTSASDTYQLGVVLYELIADRLPLSDAPKPPSVVAGASRPTDLDRVCLKALQVEPEDRYASIADFVADIDLYLQGRPVRAAPDSALYRSRRFILRHLNALASAAALIGGALAAGFLIGRAEGSSVLGLPVWSAGVLALVLLVGSAVAWRRRRTPAGIQADTPSGVASRPDVRGGLAEDAWETGEGGPAVDRVSRDTSSADVDARSVAVLPFRNLSLTEDAEALTAGLHDDLVTALSKISGLTVISRRSVRLYRDTDKPIPQIATELGVGTIVEGGVQIVGDRLRVNVQLIDGPSDHHRWAETYDQELSTRHLLEIQTEVTQRVAASLETELSTVERDRVARPATADIEAYRLYANGRDWLDQRTEEGLRRAMDHFERAIERDADYGLAWAGLAEATVLLEIYDYDVPDHACGPADAARRALELDPNLAEAHLSLGIMHIAAQDAPPALAALTRALELSPSDAEACIWLAWLELILGRPSEAVSRAERALELDPLSPVVRAFAAEALLAGGHPRRALAEARRAREIQPDWALALFMEGLALLHLDRFDEVATIMERILDLVPSSTLPSPGNVLGLIGLARARAGDRVAARECIERLHSTEGRSSLFGAGLVHAALDDRDRALELFRQVDLWRFPEAEQILYLFPDVLDPLRQDPGFGEILRNVGRDWSVQPLAETAAPRPLATAVAAKEPSSEPAPHRRSAVATIALIAGALAGGLLIGRGAGFLGDAGDSRVTDRTIAVLPFQTAGGEESTDFSRGLHDGLLTRLTNVAALTVKSRTSTQHYEGTDLTVPEIAGELNVAWVVEGAVFVAGDQVRVNATLIDAHTDDRLWSRDYEREVTIESVFDIQSDLAQTIALSLEAELSQREQERLTSRPTNDLEAYRLYIQGRTEMERRTLPALLRAIDHFERAIQRDSAYAGAWSGSADARMLLAMFGHDRSDSLPARALADARRALALDPDLAEAHASLGQLYEVFFYDTPRAHAELETAIERNPSYAAAHQWMGNLEGSRGRRDEALEHVKRAAELDPFSSVNQLVLGWTYWWVEGPGTDALFHIREAQTLAPGFAVAHVDEGLVLSHAGRHDEAVAALTRGLDLAIEGTFEWHVAIAGLGVAHARAGDTTRARNELDRLRESEGSQFFQAMIQAAMGDVEAAFLALDEVEWTRVLTWDLHVFPALDILREDPRYEQLVAHTNEMWGLRADGSLPDR